MKKAGYFLKGTWVVALSMLVPGLSFSQTHEITPQNAAVSDPYYHIGKIRVKVRKLKSERVTEAQLLELHQEFAHESASTPVRLNEEGQNPLGIADIALKVWDIIQENKAVLNVSTQNVKALPILAKDHWEALTGWKPEHGLEYTLELENLYGIQVVKIVYAVKLIYGGSVKGVGKYIASARIVPKFVDVLWGFTLDVSAREVAVQNLGTEKNPFAAITLEIGLTYGSILRKMSETMTYRLDANGEIQDLNSGTTYFRN